MLRACVEGLEREETNETFSNGLWCFTKEFKLSEIVLYNGNNGVSVLVCF